MREFVVYEDHAGQWIVECRDLPGFRARGASREEAIERMKDAIRIYDPCRCEDDEREDSG